MLELLRAHGKKVPKNAKTFLTVALILIYVWNFQYILQTITVFKIIMFDYDCEDYWVKLLKVYWLYNVFFRICLWPVLFTVSFGLMASVVDALGEPAGGYRPQAVEEEEALSPQFERELNFYEL